MKMDLMEVFSLIDYFDAINAERDSDERKWHEINRITMYHNWR